MTADIIMRHILGFSQLKNKPPTLQISFVNKMVKVRGLTLFRRSGEEQSLEDLEEILAQL